MYEYLALIDDITKPVVILVNTFIKNVWSHFFFFSSVNRSSKQPV